MSADYETESLKAYFHDEFVHITDGGYELIDLTWERFKEISEIMRRWKHRNDDKEE